jgi:2-succinyl-5-enolpyruvyl-6-hydroxy-3-cyclohexene-1-carboxylate synthase
MTAGGPGDADTQAAFASTLVDEWVRSGVAHAVVCPGSRSTPITMALAAHPGMVVHVRLDERSAGFTALGIGLATHQPALVVTTSGTAAAELHAAVVEADQAGVPLIVCTADRPPELRDVGAPQTIDQTRLFGVSQRWFCDPGVPTPATRPSWRSLASRAVAAATSGTGGPGPVHLNLPFREPLLGDPAAGGGVPPGRPGDRPWHDIVSGPVPPPVGSVSRLLESGVLAPWRRGLIVAGAGCGDPSAVLALSAALGWPILADPRSGLRRPGPVVISAADGILRSPRFSRSHTPETILRLGERWVSKVVNGFLSSAVEGGAGSVIVDPWGRWPDPERHAASFIRCDPGLFCAEATAQLEGGRSADVEAGGREWCRAWLGAEAHAQRAISHAPGSTAGSVEAEAGGRLSEPSLARRLFAHLPGSATLVVSSSMPIRDLEAFAAPRPRPPRVLANRGANGIDGVVSTALGVALSTADPTVALVGDLALLHDLTALVGAPGFSAPLTVVVADNAGGGIFSFLDPASALDPDSFDALFGTPQSPDPAAVAAACGWPVDDVGAEPHSSALEEALDRRLAGRELSVIRVQLPERSENVAVHERINDAIVAAVDDSTGRAGV